MRLKSSLESLMLILFLSVPLSKNNYFYYMVFLILLACAIVYDSMANSRKGMIAFQEHVDKYPLILILVWVFSFLYGLLRGNKPSYVIRNFAGTICYFYYYAISNGRIFSKKKLSKILICSSIIAAAILIITSFLRRTNYPIIWPLINIEYNIYTTSILSPIGALVYVLEAVCIWEILKGEHRLYKKFYYIILFFIATYALIGTNDMGGYKLGYLAILWCTTLMSLSYRKRKTRNFYILIILFLVISSGTVIIYDLYSSGKLSEIFSPHSLGNDKRIYQFQLVLERFKMLGNGLGASFNYQYKNKILDGYSIEVSYLNLFDKYGLFSLPVFYIFFKTITIPINNIRNGVGTPLFNIISMGLTGYFYIAAGNPVLLSPYNVLLHCFALYLLRKENTITC